MPFSLFFHVNLNLYLSLSLSISDILPIYNLFPLDHVTKSLTLKVEFFVFCCTSFGDTTCDATCDALFDATGDAIFDTTGDATFDDTFIFFKLFFFSPR